jgi:hypothetical protein
LLRKTPQLAVGSKYFNIMDADNSDIIIGVIGMTGAGKTTFISKASGRNDLEIGHSLDSCMLLILNPLLESRLTDL